MDKQWDTQSSHCCSQWLALLEWHGISVLKSIILVLLIPAYNGMLLDSTIKESKSRKIKDFIKIIYIV